MVLLVVWAGWALFTYFIAVEVVAAIRGVRAPRIRLATPLHILHPTEHLQVCSARGTRGPARNAFDARTKLAGIKDSRAGTYGRAVYWWVNFGLIVLSGNDYVIGPQWMV